MTSMGVHIFSDNILAMLSRPDFYIFLLICLVVFAIVYGLLVFKDHILTKKGYVEDEDECDAFINDVTNNPHQVTSSQIDTYVKCKR